MTAHTRLSILAAPTGCGYVVNMKGFDQLGDIGSLGSITSLFTIMIFLYYIYLFEVKPDY